MSFDGFDFDTSVLESVDSSSHEPNEYDKAVMALLKRLLQTHGNEKLLRLEQLRQQLEQDFLLWVALLNEQHSQDYSQQISKIMHLCKHRLRHPDFHDGKILDDGFNQKTMQLCSFVLDKVQQDILLRLNAAIPTVIGYTEQFSLTAINCFDERIELQVSDLIYLDSMVQGIDGIKMDLPRLMTLELGLPVKKENKTTTSSPVVEIQKIFKQIQDNAQQKLSETKQMLSLLTKAMLRDDINTTTQNQISTLQSETRQQASQLQQQTDDFFKFCRQFETDLQGLLA